MAKKEVKLKVVEAQQDDAYKGIARVDAEVMRELGIRRGDVINIEGNRMTVAVADRAYPADVGEGIIRIDGILRRNSKTGIGEMVRVSKSDVKEAKKLIIAPAQKNVMVQAEPESLRRGLLGRSVVKGDLVVLGGVHRRRDLLSEEFGGDIGDMLGDMLGNMGFGNVGGFTQIKFMIINTSPNQPVVITENTKVTLNPKAVEVTDESIPEITYEDIGGLNEEIKKIREMVEIPLKHPEIFHKLSIEPPKGVLLHGPPGTGKTLLAKAVANESEANFILLNGPEIMSKFYGESEKKIRNIFEEAEKTSPAIIFIDEIDAIAPKREDVSGEVERRVVSQILTMMDGLKSRGKVIVIGATNRVNAIDPALRRPGRFDREIEVGVPSKEGRLSVLKIHTRGMPLAKDVKLDKIASMTHGFVGADLESLCKESAMNVLRKVLPKINLDDEEEIPQEILEKLVVKHDDFMDALRYVRPSAMREVLVETPNVDWKKVGGLESVKQELVEAVEWPLKKPEIFQRMGIRPSRGILLYGPPGTGKTLLAKAVAKESEANFIQVKGPSLLSMWVGKSLPYNEEIIVKDKGIVKRMSIGDIVENKLDVQVLAFDKDKRIRFMNISDHIKHKLDTKLMEVTTRTGRKIRVTDYHSLFSLVNGKLTDVPTNQLIPNESYIAVPKNLNLPREKIKEINLYKKLKDNSGIFVSNISKYVRKARTLLGLEKTAEILRVSKKYLADIIGKGLPVKISNFHRLMEESEISPNLNEIKIKIRGSKKTYPSIMKIDSDFWKLIGLWIAEGDFNSGVRIHNKNPEIRRDLRKICLKYGFKLNETESSASINSLFLKKVFENVLKLREGAKEKRLPELAFILDEKSKANLLKGYFSGDGSIYKDERGKYKIEASTISKNLANDLLYLLLDFGIVARVYTKKTNKYSDTYRIMILGVNNFERFLEIGFLDSKRNSWIYRYIKSRKWSRSDLIPLSGELNRLASNHNSVYHTNQSIGKQALKSALLVADKTKTKYKEYWDLIEGDIYLDLVKEVKVIDYEEDVYDIEVPGMHNFVGGFGGIIAHNSEEGMRKVFERARQVSPCVIFFDEIDALAGKRSGGSAEGGSKVTERVLNQMLAEMDGLEDLNDVLVIGATNRPDMVDPALLRPGRFDKVLLVGSPSEKGREEILKIHTKKMPLDKGISIKELAKKTEGYTGADIEAIAREAAMIALREDEKSDKVKKKHFMEAMKKIMPSVSQNVLDVYKKIEDNYIKSAKTAVPMEGSYLG